jgi:nucleoside-diphosphate-sugar epimerase
VKLAVSGATGFIGGHVVAQLERYNVDYVGLSRSRDSWSAKGPLVKLSLTDARPGVFDRLGRPDALLHLAWDGLPNYRSLHHFESELPRQYAFLRKLVEEGIRRLTVVGTCLEYGMRDGELGETMQARPETPYGLAKNTLRQQLEYLCLEKGVEFTWARLFYMWGEGQAKSSLYPLLRAAVARNEKVFRMSGGEQLRDYLPVTAVADYLVRLALQARGAGVVNVCSGRPVSVRRLVEGWIADNSWDVDLELGHYPYPDYEPMAFWGSTKKLQLCLSRDVNEPARR